MRTVFLDTKPRQRTKTRNEVSPLKESISQTNFQRWGGKSKLWPPLVNTAKNFLPKASSYRKQTCKTLKPSYKRYKPPIHERTAPPPKKIIQQKNPFFDFDSVRVCCSANPISAPNSMKLTSVKTAASKSRFEQNTLVHTAYVKAASDLGIIPLLANSKHSRVTVGYTLLHTELERENFSGSCWHNKWIGSLS